MKKSLSILITSLIIFSFLSVDAYSQMFWNQAASFNASGISYAAFPNSSLLNITGSFTLEAWVNPSTAGSGTLGIICKSKTTFKYALNVESTGRVRISTNNVQRLLSRTSTAIAENTWSHVAATFNSSTGVFRIFINGVIDTSVTHASAIPTTSTDSLYIGNAGITTPITGLVDDVRIWNRELSNAEINRNRLTPLGVTGGVYAGLVHSITFQNSESSGSDFSLDNMSGSNSTGFNRNVTAVDLSDNPSNTVGQNDCVEIKNVDDYLSGPDSSSISPFSAITLECWVYPTIATACRFISKGSTATPNYALTLNGGHLSAIINGTLIPGAGIPTLKQWTHFAFTYNEGNGRYFFYKNGIAVDSGIMTLGSVINDNDSLYIGGGPGSIIELVGFIDEVRIANYVKSQNEIVNFMHESIDEANNPAAISGKNVVYNLDGLGLDNSNSGGPRLFFRNLAKFAHSSSTANQPVSPLNRADALNFTEGYYLKTLNKRIPASGTAGTITDTVSVNLDQPITDINFYVALNHSNSSNIEITLIAPNGDSAKVFDNNTSSGNSDNIVTIFDDGADSSLINGRYATFSNVIKPVNNMNSVFAGDRSQGKWKIRINDVAAPDTGVIYAWGIQINNKAVRDRNINLSALVQGFFNTTTQLMVPDTLKVTLRSSVPPFQKIDSASAKTNNLGDGLFSINGSTIKDNINYYIQVSHRNSIETWSAAPQKFSLSEMNYDFRTSVTKAFGSNQIFVATAPLRVAIYSGDPNQDESVNLTDIVEIFNAATNFQSGYIRTDVNGDNSANLSDIILTFNNSNLFVHTITP